MRKALKQTSSPSTIIDSIRTSSLAPTSRARPGTAARVVRMDPELYSEVMKSEPITPAANWASVVPPRLVETGSKVSLPALSRVDQLWRMRVVISTLSPMVKMTKTMAPSSVERTVRNLIHSLRGTEARVTWLLTVALQRRSAVLHGVGGQFHEDLLERGALGGELVEGDTRGEGDLAHTLRGQPGDAEGAVVDRRDRGAAGLQGAAKTRGVRAAHEDRALGDEAASSDDDDLVRGDRHLAHQVRAHEDGAALVGQRAEELTDPPDPFGVEAVHRFVEQENGGVTEQRGGDAEALAHAQGELTDLLVRDRGDTRELENLLHARRGDRVGGGERAQVVASGASRVDRLGVQERSHLVQGRAQVRVGPPVDGRRALGRTVQAEHHAHRRGLARAVGTEEPGDHAGLHLEGEVVHRHGVAVPLREVFDRQHGRSVTLPTASPVPVASD